MRQDILNRATREFSNPTADIKSVLERIADDLVANLADSCLVVMVDADGVTLHSDIVRAKDAARELTIGSVMRARPGKMGEGLTGKALAEGKAITAGPTEMSELLKALPEEYRPHAAKMAYQHSLSVPIRAPSGVLGGLNLSRIENPNAFTDEDVRFAQELADHIGTALTVARTYQQHQQAARRAHAVLESLGRINEMSEKLAEAYDREAVARVVVENARTVIHADHASLVVPHADGETLELIGHSGIGEETAAKFKRFRIDEEGVGLAEVFRTGKPILTFEKGEYLRRYPDSVSKSWKKPIAAMAAIPLEHAGKKLGAMAFSFVNEVPLDDALEAFLTDFGRHAASALERARLYEAERTARREAEEATARMAILADASRLFAERQSDLKPLLESIVEKLTQVVGDSSAILLVTDDGGLEPTAVRHKDPVVTDTVLKLLREMPIKVGETLLGQVAEAGAPVLLPRVDATKLPSYQNPAFRSFHDSHPLTSMIVVPLRVSGRILGVLNLARYGDSPAYTEKDQTLALELADRAALAVSSVQALEAEREARANSERVQQHLERLNELTTEISHAATPEDVARAVVRRSHELVDASTTAIVYVDEPSGTLRLLDHSGLVPEVAAAFRVFPRDAKTPIADTIRDGKPVLLATREDIVKAYPSLPIPPEQSEKFQTLITWPLVAGTRAVGAISYTFYTPVKLDEELQRFIRDVARQSAFALERAGLYEAEKAAVRVREEFLSVASHELRTPLTPMALKLQTLSKEVGTDAEPARLRDHVDVMRRQLRKLTHLVNGLLDVTRINAGRLSLERREVNVAELVREVVTRHEPEAAASGCTLYMEVPDSVTGDFDPMRVEQITTNLLSNALKYGAGHPVRVSLTESARNIQLVVDDEGVGIDAQDLPRLFGRFERAKSSLGFSGLGLGLYITRQIVEAHGGLIRVESAPGKGSRFEVELPKAK